MYVSMYCAERFTIVLMENKFAFLEKKISAVIKH